jgi:hypothetical protein
MCFAAGASRAISRPPTEDRQSTRQTKQADKPGRHTTSDSPPRCFQKRYTRRTLRTTGSYAAKTEGRKKEHQDVSEDKDEGLRPVWCFGRRKKRVTIDPSQPILICYYLFRGSRVEESKLEIAETERFRIPDDRILKRWYLPVVNRKVKQFRVILPCNCLGE